MQIFGELETGEARSVAAGIAARQRGSVYPFYMLVVALAIGGGAVGWIVGCVFRGAGGLRWVDPAACALVGWVAGVVVYAFIGKRLLTRRFKGRMVERGFPTRFPHRLSIAPDAIRLDSGLVRREADWLAVSDLFKVGQYWVFLVHMEPWFAPSRFFADPAAERAFLREALSYMTPDARKRSAKASAHV